MHIGVCRIRFRLPGNESLKGKRRVVKSIISRVANKFSVSIAEVGDLDLWQVATLGISCVSNDKRHANEILSKVADYISDARFEIEILDYNIEIIPVFDL
ncbi:MAG: DUF503 domain-containing protein [Dehalococcoidales bacterium]